MARLSTKARSKLPKREFAGPGRSFPVNDPTHARLAIPMAKKSRNAGNISSGTMESIIAKAKARLGGR